MSDWTERAACSGVVTECADSDCRHRSSECVAVASSITVDRLFFEPGTEGIALCMGCPVWEECLRWAARSHDGWKHGTSGGLRGYERGFLGVESQKHRTSLGRGAAPDIEGAIELARERREEFHQARLVFGGRSVMRKVPA